MSRSTLRWVLASVVAAVILMAIPASSFATGNTIVETPEGPKVCAGACCPEVCPANPEVVEVTPHAQGFASEEIKAPLLPKRARAYNRIVEQYFIRMADIAEYEICEPAHEAYYGESRPSTGYSEGLARFNAVRQLLNNLLKRYDRGYAPTIEDFSGVNILSFPWFYGKPKKVEKNGEVWWEKPGYRLHFVDETCVFRLT